jgi:hypothetical protein
LSRSGEAVELLVLQRRGGVVVAATPPKHHVRLTQHPVREAVRAADAFSQASNTGAFFIALAKFSGQRDPGIAGDTLTFGNRPQRTLPRFLCFSCCKNLSFEALLD